MDEKPAPITPSIALETPGPFLDRPLTPARFFKHPEDMLDDRTQDAREKARHTLILGVGRLRGGIDAGAAPTSRRRKLCPFR
ncbi:hypothetical protein [Pseudaminobacter sp. NGMCC 1.201702]|uniref:hypothetical protein n=1 Tax=Pseudaminobacter sp. NGMCC 1.201702 TaxID=3391825 RepID=UPI0039EFDB15